MGRRRKTFGGGTIVVNAFIFNSSEARQQSVKILEFKNFSVEWARFVIRNRESQHLIHDYDIVIGPVADAVFDRELERHKAKYGTSYLDDVNLRIFISRVSQFGLNYIQYCFCTQRAIALLYKE